jgi:hypothetical protein
MTISTYTGYAIGFVLWTMVSTCYPHNLEGWLEHDLQIERFALAAVTSEATISNSIQEFPVRQS